VNISLSIYAKKNQIKFETLLSKAYAKTKTKMPELSFDLASGNWINELQKTVFSLSLNEPTFMTGTNHGCDRS
jgi:hypothetical protein